ncbi:MAG: hypothetical protein Q9184_004009 [Pyrenodesmia sp. 2 TL-2023]
MRPFEGDRLQRCPQCLVNREDFHRASVKSKGNFAKHCNVCLGTTATGQPVHDQCLLCGKEINTDAAAVSHYKSRHDININQACTASDILRRYHPESFPELDLNQGYGLLLTRQDVLRHEIDPTIRELALRYHNTPALIMHDSRNILQGHRNAFFRFFECHPISLHSHVSDATNPQLLGSLIVHLQHWSSPPEHSPPPPPPMTAPRLAVMAGSYGAGYGSLAYHTVVERMQTVACGPRPFEVDMDPKTIMRQIKKAKNGGCVVFLVEVVRSRDGRAMAPDIWQATVEACKVHGLFLIVDEALTAIRCGAPFAHQLPEYRQHGRPDLVLFGKGVRTCGIAVDWDGVNMKNLAIAQLDEQINVILDWQVRFTEVATVDSLLQSWATIVAAQKQGWPQRAVEIGHALRQVLSSFNVDPASISGLNALIWLRVDKKTLQKMMVMPAGASKGWVRWLPTMDLVMASPDQLMTKMFGQGSASYRRQLGIFLFKHGWMLGVCSICGEAMETGEGSRTPCESCMARPCEFCEPEEHVCYM